MPHIQETKCVQKEYMWSINKGLVRFQETSASMLELIAYLLRFKVGILDHGWSSLMAGDKVLVQL